MSHNKGMKNSIKFIISEAVSLLTGVIGSIVSVANIPTWYNQLDKPSYAPPNWLFAPVWTTLYILIGLSLYLVWQAQMRPTKQATYWLFGLQFLLNALWPLVFFGLHAPWVGVGVIVTLLINIVCLMVYAWSISKSAAVLLMPYAVWVAFATALNVGIALLN
jgi:tryptophan-rich sensory protein